MGLKKEESDALLGFLFNHIGRGVDWQVRIRWAPRTVVVWDVSSSSSLGSVINCCLRDEVLNFLQNRVTVHSATLDWDTGERRHLARLTPQAEAPFETPYMRPEIVGK